MSQIAKEKKSCKICGEKTDQGFNIKLRLTYICESCERSIVIQSIRWIYNDYSEKTTTNT